MRILSRHKNVSSEAATVRDYTEDTVERSCEINLKACEPLILTQIVRNTGRWTSLRCSIHRSLRARVERPVKVDSYSLASFYHVWNCSWEKTVIVWYTLCPEKETKCFFFVISSTKLRRLRWNLVRSILNKFFAKSCKRFPPHLNNVSTCTTLWNLKC